MKMFNLRHLSIQIFRLSFLLFLSTAIVISSYFPYSTQASIHSESKRYFVSVDGDDNNLGTEDSPWRTIQYGINQLEAGDSLYVRSGTYNESLKINNKGSESIGFITIQAYPGEKPIISGENVLDTRLISFNNAHYIIFDGFEIKDYRTELSTISLNAIRIFNTSSNIYIQNNHIHHIEHRSTVNANANAIKVNGDQQTPIRNIYIINNRLNDLILGSSEAITVAGNVDNFQISDNVISHINNIGIDVAGYYGTCKNCDDQPRNGLVIRNNVSNVDTITNPMYKGGQSAAAIYVDGGRDTIIDGNIVSYSNFGFSISSEKSKSKASGIVLRNNIMYKNHRAGLVIGGSSSSNGGATNNLIANNNFVLNNTINDGYGEVTFQHHVIDNKFYNNIFYTNNVTPYIHHARSTSYNNTFDFNIYYSEHDKVSLWTINDVVYRSFEQYKAVSKQDEHSLFTNPLFEHIPSLDFRLNEHSNAINKGKRLDRNNGTVDFYGNNRVVGVQIDIGAAEYDLPKLEVPVTPQPTEPSNPGENDETTNIKIDGFLDDWATLPILASGTKNLKELKATVENAILYVSIKGKLLKEKGQLYLYLPDSNKQGFEVPHWSNKQAHYLIENGIVYEYTGTGNSWSWNKVSSLTRDQIVINNDAIEYAIPFATLGSSLINNIHLGYIWRDTKGDQLPSGGNMLIINTTEQPVTPTPENIEIDGSFNDWDKVIVWDKDANTELKVTNDAQYLYFYMNTNSKIVKEQFYLNTDNDVTTGHNNTVWEKGSGIDYLIEKGIVYKYIGNKNNWSYQKISSLDIESYHKTSNTVEFKVALSQFNLVSGDKIMLGFVLNDEKQLKFPRDAKLKAYILK